MADEALFSDLVGHTLAVRLLRAALVSGRVAPAYLFAGPDGVGRRLAARRFLEGVLSGGAGDPGLRRRLAEGNLADLLWQEPTVLHQGQAVPASRAEALGASLRTPPQIRLEQVREVTRFLGRRPIESPRPMVVMEAAEAMAEAAANALLKTLEEPGDGLLILISSAPERLLVTIRSRCQWIPFSPLTAAQMETVLSRGEAMADPESPRRPDPEELMALAGGSPGALLAHRRHWQRLPEGLADRLGQRSSNPLEALELAREISENLDGEQQLWLLQWWQNALWRHQRDHRPLARLEQLRQHLLSHVQPRLAWEVTLLDLARLPGQ
jgi:DNA polymerase-3 subunit delta'